MRQGARGSVLGVTAYLILSFGIAWGFWEAFLPKSSSADLSRFEFYLLPGAFAPALATFIVRKWITREGFGDAGLGLHLRQWRYYLIAWLLPIGVVAFIVAVAEIFGLAHPDFSMCAALAHLAPQQASHCRSGIFNYKGPLSFLIVAPLAVPLLFGEEFGWRGYLQLRLFASRPTLAAVATGLIWGLWHLPLILRGFEFPGNPVIATSVFCFGTILISIIFGWLRRKSGSVWVTSLAHSATNVIGGSLTVLWFPDLSVKLIVGYLGYLSWIPLGLLCVWIVIRQTPARGDDSVAEAL